MGFHEVQFPDGISYGSRGGPGFKTHVITTDGGYEERLALLAVPRYQFEAAFGVKSHDDLGDLMEFYIARQGVANGFRYKDWRDFTTNADHRSAHTNVDVSIGTGDGTKTDFQLIKKYTSGAVTRTRNITKPVTGTVKIAIDAVDQTSGWTVNTTTGIVTFTSAPAVGEDITAGFEFDVPVRFGEEIDELLNLNYDDFSSGSASVPLIEVVDEVAIEDEFHYGGAKDFGSIADNITVSLLDGRVLRASPSTSGVKMTLPDATNLELGGPLFFITNYSATDSLSLRNDADTEVLLITVGISVIVCLGVDNVAAKTWYVF